MALNGNKALDLDGLARFKQDLDTHLIGPFSLSATDKVIVDVYSEKSNGYGGFFIENDVWGSLAVQFDPLTRNVAFNVKGPEGTLSYWLMASNTTYNPDTSSKFLVTSGYIDDTVEQIKEYVNSSIAAIPSPGCYEINFSSLPSTAINAFLLKLYDGSVKFPCLLKVKFYGLSGTTMTISGSSVGEQILNPGDELLLILASGYATIQSRTIKDGVITGSKIDLGGTSVTCVTTGPNYGFVSIQSNKDLSPVL